MKSSFHWNFLIHQFVSFFVRRRIFLPDRDLAYRSNGSFDIRTKTKSFLVVVSVVVMFSQIMFSLL